MLAQRVASAGNVPLIGSGLRIFKSEEGTRLSKDQMFIDLARRAKKMLRAGELPGDPIVPVSPFIQMKNRYW